MTFTNKFVMTTSYKSSVAKNDIDAYLYMAQPVPEFSMPQKIEQIIRSTDETNVNVFKFGTDYVTVSDTWKVYLFNRTNLNTIKPIYPEISGMAPLELKRATSTSHPLPISGTDYWLTFYVEPGFRSAMITIVLIKSANERQLITRIPVEKNYYMHSFGATENYAVLFAHPFHYSLATILETVDILHAFEWNPENPTYIYVVNLKTVEVRKFITTESRFFTHYINGFEISDHNRRNGKPSLVMDLVTFNDSAVIKEATIDILNNTGTRRKFAAIKPEVMRYIVHLSNGTVTRHTFPTKPRVISGLDFPAINEKFRYRRYCNVYGTHPNYCPCQKRLVRPYEGSDVVSAQSLC